MTLTLAIYIAIAGAIVVALGFYKPAVLGGSMWWLLLVLFGVVMILADVGYYAKVRLERTNTTLCADLKNKGVSSLMKDGECLIELKPGVYQVVSGRRIHIYTREELLRE